MLYRFRCTRYKHTRSALLGVSLLVFASAWWQSPARSPAAFLVPDSVAAVPSVNSLQPAAQPEFRSYFASRSVGDHVHSASITDLANGDLMAVWYAGSREGASDVNIRAARFDIATRQWSEEFVLISRDTTETVLRRNIRKLGNPVIARSPDDRLWLFYVSVSLGGWAGSAINSMYSDDSGETWSEPRRLISSPFFNISTLVRNAPIFHQDGSIGLPIYHEFLGKFPEYLYLDSEGRIIDKYRIAGGDNSLQPSVVALDENKALALLRNADDISGRVLASFTNDRGQSWSPPVAMAPWNPDSAVAAVGEGGRDADVLVALNDLQDGRFRLSLYHADRDLKTWQRLDVIDEAPVMREMVDADLFRKTLAQRYLAVSGASGSDITSRLDAILRHGTERACDPGSGCEFKYEYPTLIRSQNGYYHLVYSWNNTFIKHVVFNHAWLESRL